MNIEIKKGVVGFAVGFDQMTPTPEAVNMLHTAEEDCTKLRAEVELWKKRYYDVADAVCAESKDCEDLCRQARDTRAEVQRLKADKARFDWLLEDVMDRYDIMYCDRDAIDAAMKGDE